MIEKIREEIDSYMRENIRIESYSEFCAMAEHFYNLALADVRAKAEEYHKEISEGKVDCYDQGFLMMACYENIIDFIDEQKNKL